MKNWFTSVICAAFLMLSTHASANPTIVFEVFTQTGGPPPLDVTVKFKITDLNPLAWLTLEGKTLGETPQPLWLSISGWEHDLFLNPDDPLGSFMFMLTAADVTAFTAGGYISHEFTHTFAGGVALGGGLSDNQYYLQLDMVKAHVPEPSSVLLLGLGLIGLAAFRRVRIH